MKRVVIDVNSVLPLYRYGWISGIGRTTKELVETLDGMGDLPLEVMLYSQNTKRVTARRMETHFSTRHLMLPHKKWMSRMIGMTHLREALTRCTQLSPASIAMQAAIAELSPSTMKTGSMRMLP